MGRVTLSILCILFHLEFIIGNLGNGFIILVNCMDLVKRRMISAADHILTALAISRLVFLWFLFINWWMYVFYLDFLVNVSVVRITYFIWTVTFHFNVWLATCLSIFYCLKIATFSNSIFIYLKWRVKKVVSVMLLVSVFLLFLHLFQSNTRMDVWIDKYRRNMSHNCSLRDCDELLKFILFSNTIFTLLPFAVSLTTFLLLIFSLWRHLKRMQQNAGGSRDAGTTAHTKALQTVVAFLLLYTIFFLFLLIQVCRPEFLIFFFCKIAEISFPSVHSLVLVLGNSKLKQAFVVLSRRLRHCSKDVESSSPQTA